METAPSTNSPFLTPVELAERWRCKPRNLEEMRANGTGPAYTRTGGGLRGYVIYRLDLVEAWERANTFTSTTEETEARKAERAAA